MIFKIVRRSWLEQATDGKTYSNHETAKYFMGVRYSLEANRYEYDNPTTFI